MKTLINILILLIFNVNLVFGYQMYSTTQQNHSRIGYTTNYSNGNFTPSTYQNRTMQYQSTYRIGYTTGNTYGSTNTGGSYRPGMRKITVHNGQGGTEEAPGNLEGWYKYDEVTRTWYYSPDEGAHWYEWREASGWREVLSGLIGVIFGGSGLGNDWRTINNPPGEGSGKWATDPNDPFLEPIGDGTIPLSLLMLAYLSYNRYRKKQRHCKH